MKSRIIVFFLVIFSLCSCVQYDRAPNQELRPQPSQGEGYSVIKVVNTAGDVVFNRGVLNGLILAHHQMTFVEIPWGAHRVCWSQALLNDRVVTFCQDFIITNRTMSMVIRPPRNESVFRYRGRGSLQLYDFDY
ncbi:hypothetical protein C0583_05815 [Candidatus Parcubacteria bacterium]|nr:MAG: hypothetical protein C0583_05815 [Candidatus Parcubacteria bacterium]